MKIALSSNDDKRLQSIDSIETYAYGTRKYLVVRKKKLNVTIQKTVQKMFNFDYITK